MSKVLILGAGASFGHGAQTDNRPPLACGFFSSSIQKRLGINYSGIRDFLSKTLCLDLEIIEETDIEEMCARVEAAWWLADAKKQFIAGLSENVKMKILVALGMPTYLLAYIYDVVSFSTNWLLEGKTCPFHDRIAQSWISPGDAVINFNYDQIMRSSLNHKKEKESIRLLHPHGEAMPSSKIGDPLNRIDKEPIWMHGIVLRGVDELVSNKIDIQKLNFENKLGHATDKEKEMLADLHKDMIIGFAEKSRHIVTPSPYKDLPNMRGNWGEVVQILSSTDEAFACGFSFRDTHFNEVVRQAMRNRDKTLKLTIITRDKPSFKKIQEEFRGTKVNVTLFKGWLEQFVMEYAR